MKWPLLSLLFLSFLFSISCSNPITKIFGDTQTAHKSYASKVEKFPGGKEWVIVSRNSLLDPNQVQLPYRHLGHFPNDKVRALTLQFHVRRGEKLSLAIQNKDSLLLFADVFKLEGTNRTHVLSLEKDSRLLSFDAEESGTYLLRLQPPLESNGVYELTILSSPSLGFPVAGNKARVGSIWGDSRDNGERSHEGIDIFAAKLTPAIASADGTISSVKEGGLGGKTVNLKVKDRNLNLYYAHLEQQLVEAGQLVKKGDTIGLVGNTGNAQTTSPHLHFGIYTYGGAIDPLPFVEQTSSLVPAVANKDLLHPLQLTKDLVVRDTLKLKVKTKLLPLAVTASGYLAELDNGRLVEVRFKQVKRASPLN